MTSTGWGAFVKSGAGTLRLDDINVAAEGIETTGILDLHGRQLATLWPIVRSNSLSGTITDTIGGGELRLRHTAITPGLTLASLPTVVLETSQVGQTLAAPPLNGVGLFKTEGPGKVTSNDVACRDLDLVSGTLELLGISALRVSTGTARLRSGAVLQAQLSGRLSLLGNSTLNQEGATLTNLDLFTQPGVGQVVQLTGLMTLTPAILNTSGAGITRLQGVDATVPLFGNLGTLDLNDRTLTVTSTGVVTLAGRIQDGGTSGLLSVRGTLANVGVVFESEPNLLFSQPDPMLNTGWKLQAFSGLGTVTVQNGMAIAETSLTCRELIVESGLRTISGHSGGTQFTRFRPGSSLGGQNSDTGTVGPLGNGKLVNEGATFQSGANLGAVSALGESSEFTGLPITGSPDVTKSGEGTLVLLTSVQGDYWNVQGGRLDAGGQVFGGTVDIAANAGLIGSGEHNDGSTFIRTNALLAPAAAPSALRIRSLNFGDASAMSVPLVVGGAPIVVPPGGGLNLPSPAPEDRIAVTVTGSPVAGQTYDLMTWTGAGMDAPASISKFRLVCNLPGYLKLNATNDTLQFVAFATDTTGWKDQYFSAAEQADPDIGGMRADPDGDGLDNLTEYALALHPRQADSIGVFDYSRGDWAGVQVLSCRFVRPCCYATEVVISGQHSPDLGIWYEAGFEPYAPEDNGLQEFIAWTPREGPRRMLRLKFEFNGTW